MHVKGEGVLKVGIITILAGLPLVASGAEACVVSDADPGVFARRFALRFGVENEPDRYPARSVRPRGADADQSRQEHRRTETCKTHVWWCGVPSNFCERKEQWTEMEEESTETSPRRPRCCCCCTVGRCNRSVPGRGSVLLWGLDVRRHWVWGESGKCSQTDNHQSELDKI